MFNLFRKKAKPTPRTDRMYGDSIYDYRILDADQLTGYENAIRDIYERKYDGLLIRNALSEEMCDTILKTVQALPESEKSQMPVGWVFPVIFAKLINESFQKGEEEGKRLMVEYFKKTEAIQNQAAHYFGVDTKTLIDEWLGKFSGGLPVEVPLGYDNKGKYANTNFRLYHGQRKGNISIHCGNWFQTIWKQFYGHLETQVDVYDQLSYFFMLQTPESGGELTLYDFNWEDGQSKASNHENQFVIMPDGSQLDIEKRKKLYLNPQKGDMILFAGGQIWHRVEEVLGKRPRITLAGFLSLSHDKSKVYYWT